MLTHFATQSFVSLKMTGDESGRRMVTDEAESGERNEKVKKDRVVRGYVDKIMRIEAIVTGFPLIVGMLCVNLIDSD
mgnify:CR=1 FL=1